VLDPSSYVHFTGQRQHCQPGWLHMRQQGLAEHFCISIVATARRELAVDE
jgi:hypothetical protein